MTDPHRIAPFPPRITPRERDTAAALLRGLSDKQIARELGISVRTVETHTRSLRLGFRVSNRVQLALELRDVLRPSAVPAMDPDLYFGA